MGPVELLRNKRKALVTDDEAILLLLLAKGAVRPHELRNGSEMPDRTFWRCLQKIQDQGWVESKKSKTGKAGEGPGKKTVLALTTAGESLAGRILGVETAIKMVIDGVPAIDPAPAEFSLK